MQKNGLDSAGMCGNFGRLRGWQQLVRVVHVIEDTVVVRCSTSASHPGGFATMADEEQERTTSKSVQSFDDAENDNLSTHN